MEAYCDLHTHSCFSDGTCTPEEILDLACAAGLSAVALTDHNTLEGLPRFHAAAKEKDITAVSGVEISTDYRGKELHIVGLFISPEDFGRVTDFLDTVNRRKDESNRQLIHALCQGGYPLDYEEILRCHPDGTVNRAVIAAALLEKGYVPSVSEAFHSLLSPQGGFFSPPERIDVFDAISFLVSICAVPILAHPFLSLSEGELREFLPEAKKQGLVAMETDYSSYSEETANLAKHMAAEYGLLPSGGSDFHGNNKPDIRIGTGAGSLRVPITYADKLREVTRK